MKRTLTFFLCILLLQIFTACDNSTPEKSDDILTTDHQIIGVSIWDKISTRSEPRRASSSTTLLSLEKASYTWILLPLIPPITIRNFLKARLSDSTIVWVYSFASVLNAKPAAITKEVPLYMRPDLLTITDKGINTMEIVAVVEEWDNWIKVVNEKKERVGWIKKDFITYNTIDLAFALIAKRKLEEADPEEKVRKIEDLLKNNPYPTSVFITELEDRLNTEKEILRESRRDKEWEDDKRRRND